MLLAPERLSGKAQALIADTGNDVFVSAASIWEIAIKHSSGRADFGGSPDIIVEAAPLSGICMMPVTAEDALAVMHLPWRHKDPFDRLLVAQAQNQSAHLLTADHQLADYGSCVHLV